MVTGAKVVKKKTWIGSSSRSAPTARRMGPGGRVGCPPQRDVDPVKTGSRTVEVFRKGVRVKTFRAAVGTGGTPTPKGLFAIWDPVPTTGQLVPYILVLTAHSTVLRTFGEVTASWHPRVAECGRGSARRCRTVAFGCRVTACGPSAATPLRACRSRSSPSNRSDRRPAIQPTNVCCSRKRFRPTMRAATT